MAVYPRRNLARANRSFGPDRSRVPRTCCNQVRRLLVRPRGGSQITAPASGDRTPQGEVSAGRSRAHQLAQSSSSENSCVVPCRRLFSPMGVDSVVGHRRARSWPTSSATPCERAIARRLTSTSRDSTWASSGLCSRPAARGLTAECVAKRSSRSEPSGDRFGPAHPFTFAKVERAPDPPLA